MELKNLITNWNHPVDLKSESKLENELILKLISAAHWAPSAENEQVWKFFIITENNAKNLIVNAIRQQDPRLMTKTPITDTPKLSSRFKFSPSNFNAETDKYNRWIEPTHNEDMKCAKKCSFFIIFFHTDKVLGETFGQTEIGASINNTILTARTFGYNCRLIRNFDRDYIKEQFNIPEGNFVDAILAVGIENFEDNNKPEIKKKEYSDYYFMNKWGNKLNLPQMQKQENINEYNVNVIDAIVDRRSIRNFREDKKIPQSIIYELIEAGMMPPLITHQPYIKVIIVDDSKLLQEIADNSKIVLKQKHVQQVPLLFVITYDCSNNSPGFYAEIDTGAIIQNILLRAHSLGIGSCWIGAFSRRITKNILNIPDNWYIPSLAIFGYPNDYPRPTPRKDLGKICYINEWENEIQKRKRSLFPSSHIFSILLRKIHNTRKKTILRDRKVGKVINIPEFTRYL
ncbi:MAG: hypothetical protein EU541_06270 [Promethearchaeota archaeon]|nr:MAG: hypothetical protein EU541_06270 [Candidatus Lokiarchaeota archaeon]